MRSSRSWACDSTDGGCDVEWRNVGAVRTWTTPLHSATPVAAEQIFSVALEAKRTIDDREEQRMKENNPQLVRPVARRPDSVPQPLVVAFSLGPCERPGGKLRELRAPGGGPGQERGACSSKRRGQRRAPPWPGGSQACCEDRGSARAASHGPKSMKQSRLGDSLKNVLFQVFRAFSKHSRGVQRFGEVSGPETESPGQKKSGELKEI